MNHYRDRHDGLSYRVSGTEGSESKQEISEGEKAGERKKGTGDITLRGAE